LVSGKEAWRLGNIENLFRNRGFYREGIEFLKRALLLNPEDNFALDRMALAVKSRDEEVEKLRAIEKEALKLANETKPAAPGE